MSLFDSLISQADQLGAKFGVTPDQVQSIATAIQSKVGDGSSQIAAIEEAAREHGLPVDTVQGMLNHAGGGENVMGTLGGLASGFFNKS